MFENLVDKRSRGVTCATFRLKNVSLTNKLSQVLAQENYSCNVNSDHEFSCVFSVQTSMDKVNQFIAVLKQFEKNNRALGSSESTNVRSYKFGSISPKL